MNILRTQIRFVVFVAFLGLLEVYNVSEGRKVQSVTGLNVFFSWIIDDVTDDALQICHGELTKVSIWSSKKIHILNYRPDQMLVSVEKSAFDKLTINVTLLNIKKNYAGPYKVVRKLGAEVMSDTVLLEIIENIYETTSLMSRKDDTEEINHHATTDLSRKDDTEETTILLSWKDESERTNQHATTAPNQKDGNEGGIMQHTTARMASKVDAKDFPSKLHLLYIVLGNGAVMAIIFLACLLHKKRICFKVDRVSNSIILSDSNKARGVEHLKTESLHGTYWTIVSNERGELSTSIEANFERSREQLLTSPTMGPTENETGEILMPYIKSNEESDEYLNPVTVDSIEMEEYIHHVISDPVELEEYIHPVNFDAINKSIHFSHIL